MFAQRLKMVYFSRFQSHMRPDIHCRLKLVTVKILFPRTITSKCIPRESHIEERKRSHLKDNIQSFVDRHKYFMFCVATEACKQKFHEKITSNKLGESFCSTTSIWQFPWNRETLYENSENVFAKGYGALEQYVHHGIEGLDESVSAAFIALERFYNNKEMHEEFLEKLNSMKTKTTVASLLTTHLLSQLLFIPRNYCVDYKSTNKPTDSCPCGCGAAVQYGATNFGSFHLFYGKADIILFPTVNSIHGNLESDCTVFHVEESEDRPDGKTLHWNWNTEEELNYVNTDNVCTVEDKTQDFNDADINEVCKQAISMSLWKHKRRLCNGSHQGDVSMVPVCLINKNKYLVVMYNADHDYMLRMRNKDSLPLFKNGRLEFSAIINLWMFIHHNLFCTQPDDDAIKMLKGTCGLVPRLGHETFNTVVKTSKFNYDVSFGGEEYEPEVSDGQLVTRDLTVQDGPWEHQPELLQSHACRYTEEILLCMQTLTLQSNLPAIWHAIT